MEISMGKMKKWRRHTAEFKSQVIQRMKTCANISELARELGVQRKLLYVWKDEVEGRRETADRVGVDSAEDRKRTQLEKEVEKLRAALAREVVKNDFFRSALRNLETSSRTSGSSASTKAYVRSRNRKAR
jgi:transposase-like protein